MNRLSFVIVLVTLGAGIALGVYFSTISNEPAAAPTPQTLQLDNAAQNDYILNVAGAFAADGDLKLAQDRLARLRDPQIAARVENFAINNAPKRDAQSIQLIRLAVALGSKNGGLIALVITATPTALPTNTRVNAPVFSSVRATVAPTETRRPIPTNTKTPVVIILPNENPVIVLPTETPTITNTPNPTNTRRPNTRVPTSTETPIPTEIPPPPAPIFEPDRSQWPGTVYYEPANVAPGEGYWHLAHAVYCDAFDSSDGNKFNFGCEERAGGSAGTSIYVMSGGNTIDVWAGGDNVADDPTIVGDKKNPGDVCECDYSFQSSNVKVNVRGAPSDAIGGFCLCSVNFGWGSHAHVRFYLYFEYRIR